ncbi:MAG: glycerophosphodiester phosphodiesterase [Proteobacteria bacterium]|nr:glycerophosphodiester phosphodiesterase [Pseudomonadota bacterium]
MVKLFAHRGFVKDSQKENSIASLQEAVLQDFSAIEFDIWFIAEKLILKHDCPKENELAELPTLRDYFIHKNNLTYWLDFKNLDEENASKVLLLVKKEIEFAHVNLDQIYFAPFVIDKKKAEKIFLAIRNIFGEQAKIVAVCEELESKNSVLDLKQFLQKNNIKFLSIFHKLLTKDLLNILSGIEIFAWTVNDPARLYELEKLGVENFATDKITPRIYVTENSSRTS